MLKSYKHDIFTKEPFFGALTPPALTGPFTMHYEWPDEG